MTDPTSMLIKRLADLQNEVNAIREDIRELFDSIRSLSDDMYDVQADLTLVHNIEGYEDWRSEIGKPVKVTEPVIEREWCTEDWRSDTGKIGNLIKPVIEEEWINQGKERLGLKPVSKPTDIVK